MKKSEKISRKKFLKRITGWLSIPIAVLWIKGVDRSISSSSKTKIILPSDLPQGISFMDKIIINKQNEIVKVFSSSCTHLGCKINSTRENELICSCHGSKFNYEGKPIVGPAIKPLKQLEVLKSIKTGELTVYV
ncbi:MAG: Rieske (2Fe-2S) protein [Bacteroidota bacterium]